MIPATHCRGVFAFEHSAAGENAQQTVAHLGLNLGDDFWTDTPRLMKAHAACAIGLETKFQWRLTPVWSALSAAAVTKTPSTTTQ